MTRLPLSNVTFILKTQNRQVIKGRYNKNEDNYFITHNAFKCKIKVSLPSKVIDTLWSVVFLGIV